VKIKLNRSRYKTSENEKGFSKFYFFMLLFISSFFVSALYFQYQNKISLDRKINEINEKIAKQEELHEELLKESEYHDSDEYIEKIARENLGMVKANEILFIDQNK